MAYNQPQDVAMYAGVLPQVRPCYCASGCAPCSGAAAGLDHSRGQMWSSSVGRLCSRRKASAGPRTRWFSAMLLRRQAGDQD
jgi:hypothetical protein